MDISIEALLEEGYDLANGERDGDARIVPDDDWSEDSE